MDFKLSIICVLIQFVIFSSQHPQSFKCGDLTQQTNFHRSGVAFKSGPFYVCYLENVWQVSDVSDLIDEVTPNGVYEYKTSKPHDIGAIVFKNSSLLRIPTEVFSKFKDLNTFSAVDVQLRLITRNDFIEAHNLTTLNLRKNFITDLEDGIFASMKKLQQLDLSSNMITVIREETFAGCGDDLYKVDLSNNRIQELDYTTLTPLAHPKKLSVELDLNGNAIKFVKESHRVSHLVFEALNLKDNFLHSFSCPDIKIAELHLENNELETISFDNCSVEYMAISKNKLRWIHVHQDLKGLIASKNEIESFVVSGDPKMYHLDLSDNKEIEHIFPTLKLMDEMQYLNLSNSIVGVLHEDTFAGMSELKYLFLRNSGIQIIPFGIFTNNKHLITLDISFNDLETIDLHMFTGLDNLRTLNLSGNRLSQIEGIEKLKTVLPELKQIGVSGNNWKCLYLSTMIRTLNQQGIYISEEDKAMNIEAKAQSSISGIECY